MRERRDTARTWSAADAFAHPLFAGALAVLVLNDHVLKHVDLLPHAITGKLSDFAGLLVAPAVLAWQIGARDRSRWIIAHALVGAVFAALELFPPLVAMVESASASIGLPMRMWADPTDLAALPTLAISFVLFGPRIQTEARASAPIVGALALLACAATSAPAPPPRYPFPPGGRIATDVFLRYTYSGELQVRVRRLRDQARVDCATLLESPELEIDDSELADEQQWTLSRGDAVPLWDRFHEAPDRACYAVQLSAHDRTWLIAWRHGAPPIREVEVALEPEGAEDGAIVFSEEYAPVAPAGVVVRPR
jgi:hypothetical protein